MSVQIMSRLPDGDFMAPHEMLPKRLPYWCEHFSRLEGTSANKSIDLLEHNCVQYVGRDFEHGENGVFIVLPLNVAEEYSEPCPGGARVWQKKAYTHNYNRPKARAHKVMKSKVDGVQTFTCTCQGWKYNYRTYSLVKQTGGDATSALLPFRPGKIGCLHVRAVYGKLFMMNWEKGWRPEVQPEKLW